MSVEQMGRKLTINGLTREDRHTGFCPQQGVVVGPGHGQQSAPHEPLERSIRTRSTGRQKRKPRSAVPKVCKKLAS